MFDPFCRCIVRGLICCLRVLAEELMHGVTRTKEELAALKTAQEQV